MPSELKPGPQLDALIARELFGWDDVRLYRHPYATNCASRKTDSGKIIPVPMFSQTGDGMVALMRELGNSAQCVIDFDIYATSVFVVGRAGFQYNEHVFDGDYPGALAMAVGAMLIARKEGERG